MSIERIVIVGGGVAADSCARELRVAGYEGDVVLVGAESSIPYDRTLLSKDFLAGSVDVADLALAGRGDYATDSIDVHLGARACGLDVDGRRVHLRSGASVSYDHVVIATGGAPARPSALVRPGVHVLRTLGDALALRERLADCSRLIVIGAGFIGGEVAATASARGVDVTMVEALEAPLIRVVGAEVGVRIAAAHRAHGVELLTGAPVAEVSDRRRGMVVTLADGRSVAGDAVVVAVGMVPDVAWLEGSGVTLGGGVITDERCATDADRVFAAGDCARWWNPRYGTLMRTEHWDTARRHGVAAAHGVLGIGEPFDPVPFFWSHQHGIHYQWVGHAPAWDAVEIEEAASDGPFTARYLREGHPVAMFAADAPRAVAAARRELESAKGCIA